VTPQEKTEYVTVIDSLSLGALAMIMPEPDPTFDHRGLFRRELRQAIRLRGGLVGEKYARADIVSDVWSEIIERAMRLFVSQLPKSAEFDEDIAKIEAQIGNTLSVALAEIKKRFDDESA
jgi:hypothetical protein